MPNSGGVALAWLAQPVTLASTVVLIVNDHVLKAAWPGPVTGKLSDAAGLVMAPALLATVVALLVPRLPVRWLAAVSVTVVGVAFTLVKLTPAGAATASAVWSAVAGPSRILADPTDLLALPALALASLGYVRAADAPVASRSVRLVRVLVIWPVAALAVAATSQVYSPYAAGVEVRDGELVLLEGTARSMRPIRGLPAAATRDGTTWRDLEIREEEARRSGPAEYCLPDDGSHCFRVLPGRLAVQERNGREWRTVWSVSAGRQHFLARGITDDEGPEADVSSVSVAALRTDAGVVAVVANGCDGFAVRDASGAWRRVGFPSSSTTGPPAPLVAPGRRIFLEYGLAAGAAALLLMLGAAVAARPRSKAGFLGAVPVIGMASLALGFRIGFPVNVLLVPGGVVLVVVAVFVAASFVLLNGIRANRGGTAVAMIGIALVGAGAAVVPMYGWSAGSPDDYGTALALSGGVLAIAAAAVTALALASRRPRSAA